MHVFKKPLRQENIEQKGKDTFEPGSSDFGSQKVGSFQEFSPPLLCAGSWAKGCSPVKYFQGPSRRTFPPEKQTPGTTRLI